MNWFSLSNNEYSILSCLIDVSLINNIQITIHLNVQGNVYKILTLSAYSKAVNYRKCLMELYYYLMSKNTANKVSLTMVHATLNYFQIFYKSR